MLSLNLLASNMALFLNLLCIALFSRISLDAIGMPMFLFGFLTLLGGVLAAVALVEKLHPEKHGDVLDMHFHREWETGFDELERAQAGKAAFSSFQVMQKVYPLAWCISLILGFAADLGLSAVCAVTILWAVQSTTHMWEAWRPGHSRAW